MKTGQEKGKPFPTFNPTDLYGRTYVTRPDDYGEQERVEIVGSKKLEDSDKIGPGKHPKDLVKWSIKGSSSLFLLPVTLESNQS